MLSPAEWRIETPLPERIADRSTCAASGHESPLVVPIVQSPLIQAGPSVGAPS